MEVVDNTGWAAKSQSDFASYQEGEIDYVQGPNLSPADNETIAEDPALQIVEVSAVKKFGDHLEPPPGAIVHFHGDDPEAGPMLRYTLITRRTSKNRAG